VSGSDGRTVALAAPTPPVRTSISPYKPRRPSTPPPPSPFPSPSTPPPLPPLPPPSLMSAMSSSLSAAAAAGHAAGSGTALRRRHSSEMVQLSELTNRRTRQTRVSNTLPVMTSDRHFTFTDAVTCPRHGLYYSHQATYCYCYLLF